MPTFVTRLFSTLEFYGKSLPGIVLSVLLLSVTPIDILRSFLLDNGELLLSNLVIVSVSIILFGFVLGQGLHTFSEVFEKYAYTLCNRIGVPEKLSNAFVPHRNLFERRIKRYDRNNETEFLVSQFLESASEIYDTDCKNDNLYTLSMSHLESKNLNRAIRLQSSYYFTRSMWLLSFIFAFIYLIVYVTGLPGLVVTTLIPLPPVSLPMAATILAIAYLNSTIKYRYYFIEYVFADFINSSEWD